MLHILVSVQNAEYLHSCNTQLLQFNQDGNNMKANETGLNMYSAAFWQRLPYNQWARAETTCDKSISIKSLCRAAAH